MQHDVVGVATGLDVAERVPALRREFSPRVLAVIAAGGGVGALLRYGIGQAWPMVPGHFPVDTFVINVLGCFLIGALMVLITEVWSAHRLLRPLLGVGLLGGFTTFSTYTSELRGLLRPGSMPVAIEYLAATPLCALLATVCGVWLARMAGARLVRS